MRPTRPPRRRGIFMLDAMLGLFLIVAVTAALGAVVANQHRAAIREADDRAAVRAAETALLQLQSHEPVSPATQIRSLDSPAPSGWKWVQALGQSGAQRAVVSGLVPAEGGER